MKIKVRTDNLKTLKIKKIFGLPIDFYGKIAFMYGYYGAMTALMIAVIAENEKKTLCNK